MVGMKSSYILPLIVLILGAVFFPVKGVAPTPDSLWYLNNGLIMFQQHDADSILIWRPVFPFLSGLSFTLFGVSMQSALLVVRLFFLFNLLLCYFLGALMFDRRVGFTFSMLVLTSFMINRISALLLLDHIISFFILLFVFLLVLALEKKRLLYFILAGVVLGSAILTKTIIAMWYLALPAIMLGFKAFREKTVYKGIGFIYISMIGVLLPWLIYVLFGGGHPQILLGMLARPNVLADYDALPNTAQGGFEKVWEWLALNVEEFFLFLDNYIFARFSLVIGILFFMGLAFLVYRLIVKRHRSAGFLIAALACFLPVVYAGMKLRGISFRHGQVNLLYMLLYFGLAILLVRGVQAVLDAAKLKENRYVKKSYIIAALVSLCVLIQVFTGPAKYKNHTFADLMTGPEHYCSSFWQPGLQYRFWAHPSIREAARWMLEHIPEDKKLLSQYFYWEALNFFMENRRPIEKIQRFKLTWEKQGYLPVESMGSRSGFDTNRYVPAADLGRPLFIWLAHSPQRTRGNYLSAYFEKALLDQVKNGGFDYVIITIRQKFLSTYLEQHPGFSLEKAFPAGNIEIYKIHRHLLEPLENFKTRVDLRAHRFLLLMLKRFPGVYQNIKAGMADVFPRIGIDYRKFFHLIESRDHKGFRNTYIMVRRQRFKE
jgi:4-amino-4-deoxy-L-arabinose transferase-like glycosyltransferase